MEESDARKKPQTVSWSIEHDSCFVRLIDVYKLTRYSFKYRKTVCLMMA